MAMTDLTLVSMLKTRMHWQQTRQKLLAENVANANTPRFVPKDLKELSPAELVRPTGGGLAMAQTSPLHLAAMASEKSLDQRNAARFETRPSGNAVNLEDEMLKASDNQAGYQLATSLYQKSLAMLRTAAGAKG
jgi:flagellar basal-body rod protein FlgB